MSLYKQYIEEGGYKFVMERQEGFITYSIGTDNIYIEEIFVQKEFRRTGVGSEMADSIAEMAKAKGFTKILGSVCPSAKYSTESIKALLAYGFKIDSSTNNFILLSKNIGEQK